MKSLVRSSAVIACAVFGLSISDPSLSRADELGYQTGRDYGLVGNLFVGAATLAGAAVDVATAPVRMVADAFTPSHPVYVEPTPVAYNTGYGAPIATTQQVSYYQDSNGYGHYISSPTMALAPTPVAYSNVSYVAAPVATIAQPMTMPVAYYGGGISTPAYTYVTTRY